MSKDQPGTAQPAQPEAGTLLGGTYRVLRLIGKGGMGQVYEVTHARLAGRYALKLLAPELTADPEALQRFQREAEIVSSLRHPHIVQVIDFDRTEDGRPYLVMEYLDGESVIERLQRQGPLPVERVAVIVKQIASALGAAHARGVVHRDLKPENVCLLDVGPEEFAKVLDFGVSKMKTATLRLTQGRMVGTPYYMAPEQTQGSDDVDERADQFSLAAMTYELLTGEVAFAGDTVAAVVYQVVYGQPPRLADAGGVVNPEADAVLHKALAKDPAGRFSSVTDFAHAFARAVSQAPPLSASTGRRLPVPAATTQLSTRVQNVPGEPARLGRWSRPKIVALVGLGLALAVGGVAWTLRRAPAGSASVVVSPPATHADRLAVADAGIPDVIARKDAPAESRPVPSPRPARRRPASPDPLYNDL